MPGTNQDLWSEVGFFFPFEKNQSPIIIPPPSGAKQETVEKVCGIVRKQLALSDDTLVTGDSEIVALGADSLCMFEAVMGLEEEFGISVLESAQSIATVQDAADLIEKTSSA